MMRKPDETPTKLGRIAGLPTWIAAANAAGHEDMAFRSGAALGHLQYALHREDLPVRLLRDRAALRAAEACVVMEGRPERAGELRDAVHLLRNGDLPGPAGDVYLQWRRAIQHPISDEALHRALTGVGMDQIKAWRDTGAGAPVSRAAAVLQGVLHDAPRAEVPALILADVALSQALGWDHIMPLLAVGLKRTDLRKTGDDLRLACHMALVPSIVQLLRLAQEVTQKSARLQSVAPKLRAKAAAAAVEIFLTQDAVAPTALPLPDRAARRFCDRLVTLGVARELTGRDTFRLYGV